MFMYRNLDQNFTHFEICNLDFKFCIKCTICNNQYLDYYYKQSDVYVANLSIFYYDDDLSIILNNQYHKCSNVECNNFICTACATDKLTPDAEYLIEELKTDADLRTMCIQLYESNNITHDEFNLLSHKNQIILTITFVLEYFSDYLKCNNCENME